MAAAVLNSAKVNAVVSVASAGVAAVRLVPNSARARNAALSALAACVPPSARDTNVPTSARARMGSNKPVVLSVWEQCVLPSALVLNVQRDARAISVEKNAVELQVRSPIALLDALADAALPSAKEPIVQLVVKVLVAPTAVKVISVTQVARATIAPKERCQHPHVFRP